jgi:Na+-driven multidrug efflux pump
MVGTNIGAGQRDRALRAAWIGAGIAAGLTEVIGLSAAAFPHAWLSLFDTDPAMLDAGSRYLYAVGPFYGLFGLGLALYFASQGAGRLSWPLIANLVRLVIAAGGGWLAMRWSGDVSYVFVALSAALAAFGLMNAGAVASGAWFGPIAWPRPRALGSAGRAACVQRAVARQGDAECGLEQPGEMGLVGETGGQRHVGQRSGPA